MLSTSKDSIKKVFIPQGTRGIVYSYLSLNALFIKISKLSQSEREFLRIRGSKSVQPYEILLEKADHVH